MTDFPFAAAGRRFTDQRDQDRFARLCLGMRDHKAPQVFRQATRGARGEILPAA